MRAANRRRRTASLLEAALKLFLVRGLEEVTIDDIVGAAGMAKGNFYRYFEDKSALVEALFATVAARVDRAFDNCIAAARSADSAEAIRNAYLGLAVDLTSAVTEHPDQIRLYLQECRSPAVGARQPVARLAQRILASAIRLTEAARSQGLLKPLDPRITARAVIGATEQLLVAYLSGDDLGPIESVPTTLISLVVDGIRR